MEFLQNHADRAIARKMLGSATLVAAALVIGFIGIEFMAAASDLGSAIGAMEVGK